MGACASNPCGDNDSHTMRVCYDRSKVIQLKQRHRQDVRNTSQEVQTRRKVSTISSSVNNPLSTTPPSGGTGWPLTGDQSTTVSDSHGLLRASRLLTSTSTGALGCTQHLRSGPLTSDLFTNLSPASEPAFSSLDGSRPIVLGQCMMEYEPNTRVVCEMHDDVDDTGEASDSLTIASAFVPLSFPNYEFQRRLMKKDESPHDAVGTSFTVSADVA